MASSDQYLYPISNYCMLVVMALLFGKTAEGFAIAFTTGFSIAFVVGVIAIITILGILMAIVVTHGSLHHGLEIPYRPLYLLILLFLAILPLFIAVECIRQTLLSYASGEDSTALFEAGLYALLVTFIAIILYLSLIFFIDEERYKIRSGFTAARYLALVTFNVIGIVLTFVTASIVSSGLSTLSSLIVTIIDLIVVLGYLVFFWALQFRFSVKVKAVK